MQNFGEKIIELRRQNNLTQADLGKKLNISAQAISKWENNQSEPDMNTLKMISSLFNVSIDELLDFDGPKANTTEQIVQPQIIIGYCSNCKAPIKQTEEYDVFNDELGQFLLCNKCMKERDLRASKNEKEESKAQIKQGFVWGSIAFICAFFFALLTGSAGLIL